MLTISLRQFKINDIRSSIYSPIYLPFYLYIYLYICISIHLCNYLCIYYLIIAGVLYNIQELSQTFLLQTTYKSSSIQVASWIPGWEVLQVGVDILSMNTTHTSLTLSPEVQSYASTNNLRIKTPKLLHISMLHIHNYCK